MKLSACIKDLKVLEHVGPAEAEITAVCFDSRKAVPGCLFVAQPGTNSDGHQYIGQVVEKGAAAVVCERLPETPAPQVTYIRVSDSNAALGYISSAWFDYPSQRLELVGVTGTNGKTTIATLLDNMFRKFGHKCVLPSTVCNYIED